METRMFLVVEGHGEVEAARNLIYRLWEDQGHPKRIWDDPIRGISLHQRKGIERACSLVRSRSNVGGLLILRDEDDGCPKVAGPECAEWVRSLSLPFPVAVTLLHREYETLFLPCLSFMAGKPLRGIRGVERPGLLPETKFEGDFESVRGVKEWLSKRYPKGRSYKPTEDQLALTRLLDFPTLRASGLACFGSLERALRFLAESMESPGRVYPGA